MSKQTNGQRRSIRETPIVKFDQPEEEETESLNEVDLELGSEAKRHTWRQKFRCADVDPYAIFILLVVVTTLAVVTYHEFMIEDQNESLKNQVEKIVKTRRFNAKQLSNILSRIDPDVVAGNADVARKACDETHCALPCIRGRSEGFKDFLGNAIETVSPIIGKIPFLPRMVSDILGPVTTMVKTIIGHPYSAASDGFCAKVIARGVGDRSVKASRKHLKNAVKFQSEDGMDSYRDKREAVQPVEGMEPTTNDLLNQLTVAFGVEPDSDDEDVALHEVLVAIFRTVY